MSTTTPDKNGRDTSEWTIAKWIMLVCYALAAGLAVVIQSGAVTDPTALAVLGGAAAVLGAVGGLGGKAYIDGRALVKANLAHSVANSDTGNPTQPAAS